MKILPHDHELVARYYDSLKRWHAGVCDMKLMDGTVGSTVIVLRDSRWLLVAIIKALWTFKMKGSDRDETEDQHRAEFTAKDDAGTG